MFDRAPALVVGVGDLPADDTVLTAAVKMSHQSGARLHVVHSWEVPMYGGGLGFHFVESPQFAASVDASGAAFAEEVRRRYPAEDITCHVEPAPAHDAIGRIAGEVHAELVLVGAHRRRGLASGLLGTTAQRVIRSSAVPVFVVRTLTTQPRRILTATDLSPMSGVVHDRGLALAEQLLKPQGAELRSLLVIGLGLLPAPLPEEAVQRAGALAMADFLSARTLRWSVPEPRIRNGSPAEEIVAEAREWSADLVILGTHARHGPSRFLLGSVAEAALRDLPCNALVVPPVPVPAGKAEAELVGVAGRR